MRELKAVLESGTKPESETQAQVGNGVVSAVRANHSIETAALQRPLGFSLITMMGFLWSGLFAAAAALTHFGSLPGPVVLFNEVVPLESVPTYVSVPGFLVFAALAAALAIGFHRVHVWAWAGVVITTGFMALSGASDLVVSLVAGGPGRLFLETVTGLPYLIAGALPFAYALRPKTRGIFSAAASNEGVPAAAA